VEAFAGWRGAENVEFAEGAGEAEADLNPTRSERLAAWVVLKGFGAARGVDVGTEVVRGFVADADGVAANREERSFLRRLEEAAGAAGAAGAGEAETKSAKSSSSSSLLAAAGAAAGADWRDPKPPRISAEEEAFGLAGAAGGEERAGPSSKLSKSSIGAAAFGGGAAAFGGARDTDGLERCCVFGFGGDTGRGRPLSANSS